MFMKHASSGDMVEVLSMSDLVDPCVVSVSGRYHSGEEMPEAESFPKSELVFPSGEALPRCWVDADYKLSA